MKLSKNKEYKTDIPGITFFIKSNPTDANEEEKPNKQFCILEMHENMPDHFRTYMKVLTVPELKKLLNIKAKERITWE